MKRIAVCLFVAAAAAAVAQPTYTGEVAPIIQEKCQRCHRPGDIAPFAMTNYEDTSIWAEDIARVVKDKIMPPWKPVPGYGEFRDNFGLTDEQRQTLLDWAEAGAPQGDASAPAPPTPPTSEWELGEPDKVIEMAAPFEVTRGRDIYRCFVLPTGLDDNNWLDAVQVVPGNRNVVHHVILYVDTTGTAEKLDGSDGLPGYPCVGGPGIDFSTASLDSLGMLGGWVPGARVQRLPEGVGLGLPKGSKIVMQVHYYPGGRPGPDQTKLGLYYKQTPVARQLRYIPVLNTNFKIPAGNNAYEVKASLDVPFFLSAKAWQIVPHMHLLGRQIKVELQNRDKSLTPMIYIDNWDFNWQNFYFYEKPVALPAQTSVKVTCTFDNSENNPKNPSNPLKTVGWGEGTEDEMCIGFLGVTFDQENLLPANARVTK
jgi:hypothetical protein